jgi:hypothetical protein
MKIRKPNSNTVIIFAAAATALFITGCAEMGSANTTSLLSAAGFRARTPQTARQKEIYAALPPYQVERATVKGKGVFYVYKDEKAGLATSVANKSTNATSSWPFSSKSRRTATWRRNWSARLLGVGTGRGDQPFGGEPLDNFNRS